MTRQQLLEKLNRMNNLQIQGSLVIDKITGALDGVEFLKDADSAFLEDIRYITGNENGIEISPVSVGLIVKASRYISEWKDPVVSFVLNFTKADMSPNYRGVFSGISDIIYRRDLYSQEKIVTAAKYEKIYSPLQMRKSIEDFIARAVERGYLVVE